MAVDTLGLDDNLFDCGGTSLTVIQLVMELEARYQVKVGIETLFQYPTLREFQQQIAGAPIAAERELKCFVPVQSSGHKPPVFSIAHAPYLGRDCPVYSFPGIYDRIHSGTERISRALLEDLVEDCVEEIGRINPEGPCSLTGYCHGGWLVLAIAQCLCSRGRRVAYIGLIETHPRRDWYRLGELRGWFASLGSRRFSVNTTVDAGRDLIAWAYRRCSANLYSYAAAITREGSKGRKQFLRLADRLASSEVPGEERLCHLGNIRAYRAFERKTFTAGIDVPIHLFVRSETMSRSELRWILARWKEVTDSRIYIHRIAGDHAAVRHNESHREISRLISRTLSRLEREKRHVSIPH